MKRQRSDCGEFVFHEKEFGWPGGTMGRNEAKERHNLI